MKSFTEQPYPGLRFYEYENAALFAGRRSHSIACTQMIWDNNVLILHGRTGCGKSSFLRAGVRPVLASGKLGIGFADRAERGFDVIRSGRTPLNKLVARLKSIINSVNVDEGMCEIGPTRSGARGAQALLNAFEASYLDKLETEMATDGRLAYEAIATLSRYMEKKPIFVIDQAEEIFSLPADQLSKANSGNAAAEIDADAKQNSTSESAAAEAHEAALHEYFRFVRLVARDKGARLVISMRTEYKGLFDDNLHDRGHRGEGVAGFFLPELSEKELVEAIKRPTLNTEEWNALGEEGPGPRDKYNFVYDEGVAENIAADLASPDDIPAGGVLPALQVTCLRLWRASRSVRRNHAYSLSSPVGITMAQKRQMGSAKDQISDFVTEAIEAECSQAYLKWPHNVGKVSDAFHRELAANLVNVEADGRAVTSTARRSDIINKIADTDYSSTHKKYVEFVLKRLAGDNWSVLRSESIKGEDGDVQLSLGHDSVALALNAWSRIYAYSQNAMMRMTMGMAKSTGDLTIDDLYPSRDEEDIAAGLTEDERPQPVTINVPTDLSWDHQIVNFAMTAGRSSEGFAQRLGIRFDFPDDLNVKEMAKTEAPSWPSLRAKIIEREAQGRKEAEALNDAFKPQRFWQDEFVLAPTEWSLFPGMTDDPKHDFIRRDHIHQWSDVAVTNISVSLGLVGAWSTNIMNLQRAVSENASDPVGVLQAQEELVKAAIEEVLNDGRICTYGRNGRRFFRLAGSLVGMDAEVSEFLRGKDGDARNFESRLGRQMPLRDPLVPWLLEKEPTGRKRFAIGGALTRAMGEQAGFQVKFSASNLVAIGRAEIAARAKNEGSELRASIRDVPYRLQDALTHTAWQLGMISAQWDQGINKAIVLRLAAIAYFTVEQARSPMKDEFVLHLTSFVNSMLQQSNDDDNEGEDEDMLRLSRTIIRETSRDCFDYLKFDEIGTSFYDVDSPRAYVTGHLELGSTPIFGDVYCELINLRAATIKNFNRIDKCVSWLKAHNHYDPTHPQIARAMRLKYYAWNNFKILNFFDSERFMATAAVLFQNHMERVNRQFSVTEKRSQAKQQTEDEA